MSAISRTESSGTTRTVSRRSTRSSAVHSSSSSPGCRSRMIEEAADGVHGDGCEHRDDGGSGGRRRSPRAAREERHPDDARRRDPGALRRPLGRLATPHRIAADQLRRYAGRDTEQRASEERGEHDDGSRGGVPASRAELDDDLLGGGGGYEQRQRDRDRDLERDPGEPTRAPFRGSPMSGIPIATRVPREGSATPAGRAQSSAAAPRPDVRQVGFSRHSRNGNGPRSSIPRSGDAGVERPSRGRSRRARASSAAAERRDRKRERDLVSQGDLGLERSINGRAPGRRRSAVAPTSSVSRARRAPA